MKLWKASYNDADAGRVLMWCATRNEAEADLKVARQTSKRSGSDFKIEAVELPDTAKGMAQWLSINFSRDNG